MNIKLVREASAIPQYATHGSAACDLQAVINQPLTLLPGEIKAIETGIALEIPHGQAGLILPRSGQAKRGLSVANAPGLIDPDYRGEIKVLAHNISNDPITIHPGDRIAQLMFAPHYKAHFQPIDALNATERGDGGFGSTGVDACGRIV